MKPLWNSLEVAKLALSLLTPIMILLIGIWVTRFAERFKALLWANQKVIEKRIAVYDELAPLLNDVYCYYGYVGNWKELTPPQVLEIKRKLDKRVYIYAPLFSPSFIDLYNIFIRLCFQTFVKPGLDAKLRTQIVSKYGNRKDVSTIEWDQKWNDMFSDPKEATLKQDIESTYNKLMSCFASELGVGLK